MARNTAPARQPAVLAPQARHGLLDLRAFVILIFALAVGIVAAIPAALIAANAASGRNALTLGLLVGLGVFVTTSLTTIHAVDNLVAKGPDG